MSEVDFGLTRDGLAQLRRRWRASRPTHAMLLVHGIAEHSGRYEHVGQFFGDAQIDTVAIDQRGFGRSGGRGAYVKSFAHYLDDVEDQLREVRSLGLPTVLCGHSMGGLIALSYALTDRPQPDRLVLSAPALGAEIPKLLRALTKPLARLLPNVRVPNPIDTAMLSTDPLVGERYLADPLVVKHTTPALGAALLTQMQLANRDLQKLRIPTLVLHGTDDRLVPPHFSEPLAALAHATRRTFPGLRHEIFNEPPHRDILGDIVAWISP